MSCQRPIVPLTTQNLDALRLPIKPSERNGLKAMSHVMVDKITTVSKKKPDEHVGRLSDEDTVATAHVRGAKRCGVYEYGYSRGR
jgi:mRNA-degrading endonuclease toxin of MazEF toxin-antitoxin module